MLERVAEKRAALLRGLLKEKKFPPFSETRVEVERCAHELRAGHNLAKAGFCQLRSHHRCIEFKVESNEMARAAGKKPALCSPLLVYPRNHTIQILSRRVSYENELRIVGNMTTKCKIDGLIDWYSPERSLQSCSVEKL